MIKYLLSLRGRIFSRIAIQYSFLCIFIISCIFSGSAFAQKAVSFNEGNHELNLQLLEKAKDSLYQQILKGYDAKIAKDPADYVLQIQRCRFIEKAYYDYYEDYNPNYEQAEACVEALLSQFPEVPEVMLLKAEYLYDEEALNYLYEVLEHYKKNQQKWEGKEKWKIYNEIAELEAVQENSQEAVLFANLAAEHNDTLDNSLFLARQYKKLNQKTEALQCLEKHINNEKQESWILTEKGKLLLELEAPELALKAFELARKDTSSWQDAGVFAKIMIENGLLAEAREYLLKDVGDSYLKTDALKNLLKYDLKYNSDSASLTYRKLVEESFWNDAAGMYRLQLLMSSPAAFWEFSDFLRLSILFLIFFAAVILPYLWVLPIHYSGAFFRNRGMVLQKSNFRWSLKHFWMASSLYFIASLLALFIFEYDTLFIESVIEESAISKNTADTTLLFFIVMLVGTLLLIKKVDLPHFWGSVWERRRSIFTGIGMAVFFKFFGGLLSTLFTSLGAATKPIFFLSIIDNVISINEFYHPVLGFLLVVIIVPFYEEILFRGVILSACQKHMKFFFANALQATLFAMIHQEWKLLPLYFVFGYLAGYYRQKSQSMAPSIAFHMTFNLIAFISILRL